MRTIWGSKEMPQTFFHNFHNAKIRFNSFDYIPSATLFLAILWHDKKGTVDQYWTTGGLDLLVPVIIAKFSDLVIAMLLIATRIGNRVL